MTRPKGHKGQNKAQSEHRKLNALELRKSGATYRQIARQLGVSHTQIMRDVQSSLAEIAQQREQEAKQLRELEAMRYDALQSSIWMRAVKGDIGAITTVLKIMQQRAQLLGLNEATKHELNVLIDVAPQVIRLVEALNNAGLKPSDVFERMIQRVQAQRETIDHDRSD